MDVNPKIGVFPGKPPKMDGEHIKIDDLGVPLFLETPIYIYIYIFISRLLKYLEEIDHPCYVRDTHLRSTP